jgi:hypothetical protein
VPHSALDTLADALEGTFPACDDAPAALALLRELARGEPVDAAAAPARWLNVKHDESGRIVAFSGLSLTPTAHRFTVAGRKLYTWCACVELIAGARAVVLGVRSHELQNIGDVSLPGQLYNVFEVRDGVIVAARDFIHRADALQAAQPEAPTWA